MGNETKTKRGIVLSNTTPDITLREQMFKAYGQPIGIDLASGPDRSVWMKVLKDGTFVPATQDEIDELEGGSWTKWIE